MMPRATNTTPIIIANSELLIIFSFELSTITIIIKPPVKTHGSGGGGYPESFGGPDENPAHHSHAQNEPLLCLQRNIWQD